MRKQYKQHRWCGSHKQGFNRPKVFDTLDLALDKWKIQVVFIHFVLSFHSWNVPALLSHHRGEEGEEATFTSLQLSSNSLYGALPLCSTSSWNNSSKCVLSCNTYDSTWTRWNYRVLVLTGLLEYLLVAY